MLVLRRSKAAGRARVIYQEQACRTVELILHGSKWNGRQSEVENEIGETPSYNYPWIPLISSSLVMLLIQLSFYTSIFLQRLLIGLIGDPGSTFSLR
jgi:hypothetical protein